MTIFFTSKDEKHIFIRNKESRRIFSYFSCFSSENLQGKLSLLPFFSTPFRKVRIAAPKTLNLDPDQQTQKLFSPRLLHPAQKKSLCCIFALDRSPPLPSRRRRKKANFAFLLRNSPISPKKLRFCNLQDITRGMTMKTFFNVREIYSCACGNFFPPPHTQTQGE